LWILQERLSADPGFQDAQGHLVGVELVRKCVSHLGVSRHGLSHGELVGTVDPVDPRGNVAALERLLRPYLMRRGELLDFYHGQLREAVEAEYLDEEQERLEAHRSLASYFSEQGYANLRTLAELPYHLTQASMWDGLEGTLTDLPFLEGKTTVGMVFDLAADFASAVDALPDERPQHRILRLLEQALCRDIRFIARHADDYPQALFQCLWNTCWWYDCPEAANHYIKPEGGWPPGEPPWDQPGRKLCELLQQWRTQKRTAVSRFVWIRSLRPPPIHLDTALLAILIGHKRSVVSVAFSPDGQRILSGALDGTVRVWDIRTSAELLCLRAHDEGVPACVSYSPDGAQIVIASGDGTLRVWDAETGRELDCVNAPEGHCGWVYSSLGWRSIRYVWPDPGNKVHVRDLQKGEELVTLSGHKESVTSIKYSPDNRRIVTGADETVRVWDAETGAELRCLQGHDGTVWSVEYSPDGHQIVSGGADTTVRVWDAEKGTEVRCLQGHKTGVRSVAFSPDGRRIASTSYDQTVRVWDAETGAELRCLQGHDGAVNSTAFSSDGRQIASASMDNTVRIWNVDSGARMLALCGHERAVNDVLHSPNGGRIVSASHDDTVRLWGSGSGVELNCLRGHDNWVSCLAYSPDGRRIASGAGDKTVRVWDAETGAELVCVQVRETPGSLAFSPDGRRILSRPRFGGSTRVFDAETGAELRCFEGHPHRKSLPPVEFSPDGRLIVSGSGDATVRIWEAETGAEIKCLQGHRDRVISIAFSPDGRWFASASDDNTIRLWDTQTGDEIRCLEGDRGAHTIAISPDGTRIVGALGREHTIRLWDTQTGDEIKCLQACQGQWLGGVAFLLDGERIVSHSSHYMGGDHDVTFQVWDAQTGECVDEIQRRRISLETALKSVTALGWRAFANSLETPVEPADGGDPIAWVPVAARHLTAHPSGRQWAGSYNKHLYILRLEGELPAPPAEPP